MYQKMSWLKKVSLMLGVATLMLGVLPVASLPGFGAFADDSPADLPAEEPVVEESVVEESKSEGSVDEQPDQEEGQDDQSSED